MGLHRGPLLSRAGPGGAAAGLGEPRRELPRSYPRLFSDGFHGQLVENTAQQARLFQGAACPRPSIFPSSCRAEPAEGLPEAAAHRGMAVGFPAERGGRPRGFSEVLRKSLDEGFAAGCAVLSDVDLHSWLSFSSPSSVSPWMQCRCPVLGKTGIHEPRIGN